MVSTCVRIRNHASCLRAHVGKWLAPHTFLALSFCPIPSLYSLALFARYIRSLSSLLSRVAPFSSILATTTEDTAATPILISWKSVFACLLWFTALWPVTAIGMVAIMCGVGGGDNDQHNHRGENKKRRCCRRCCSGCAWCGALCPRLARWCVQTVASLPTIPPAMSLRSTLIHMVMTRLVLVCIAALDSSWFSISADQEGSTKSGGKEWKVEVVSVYMLWFMSLAAIAMFHGFHRIPIMRHNGLARQTSESGQKNMLKAAELPQRRIRKHLNFPKKAFKAAATAVKAVNAVKAMTLHRRKSRSGAGDGGGGGGANGGGKQNTGSGGSGGEGKGVKTVPSSGSLRKEFAQSRTRRGSLVDIAKSAKRRIAQGTRRDRRRGKLMSQEDAPK